MLVGLAMLALALGASDQAMAARTYADYPVYNDASKPDLTIDAKRFETQVSIIDREFSADSCAVAEGAVGAPGIRRILRFDTVIINGGNGDLMVGNRSDPKNPYADYFYFATCHGHYHIRDFSVHELLSPDGKLLVAGYKQGFCSEDSFKYDGEKRGGYNCENQGVTSGWGDWYYKQLGGQWIDITGVPEGDYIVRVTINLGDKKGPLFDEGSNRYPNSVETRIHIPNPRNKVS